MQNIARILTRYSTNASFLNFCGLLLFGLLGLEQLGGPPLIVVDCLLPAQS